MANLDGRDIALRAHGLIRGQFGGDMARASRRLGVDETELRRAVAGDSVPQFDVLDAIVRETGVDACWLLTGEYDSEAHRRQLEADEEESAVGQPIVRALARLRAQEGRAAVRPLDGLIFA